MASSRSSSGSFDPVLSDLPDLPVVDYGSLGALSPKTLSDSGDALPRADVVIITWASAEWAAMEQVFVSYDSPMPYADRFTHWEGWTEYDQHMPYYSSEDEDWSYWGAWRLVLVGGKRVLLWKSNTHLSWPGASYLDAMIRMLLREVQPKLMLSIGTAGGARTQDKLGTVSVVNAGTLDDGGHEGSWSMWANDWCPDWSIPGKPDFQDALLRIPVNQGDLESLRKQFDQFYKLNYSLDELNANNLCWPDHLPELLDMTAAGTSLLTTASFVVGTTSGIYEDFSCIEMDDALIARVCEDEGVAFGFIRNVSDPVQSMDLPGEVQANWGGAVYDTYGMYTSFNGALLAWAVVYGDYPGGTEEGTAPSS